MLYFKDSTFGVVFVSDIAIFVLKRDVKLQLTNFGVIISQLGRVRSVFFL